MTLKHHTHAEQSQGKARQRSDFSTEEWQVD